MEGDVLLNSNRTMYLHFNPLPPHGGRRYRPDIKADCIVFQSTPSAWRETRQFRKLSWNYGISIHSLRMEGDNSSSCSILRQFISIHSLRMEGDLSRNVVHETDRRISIHSLRMEGDGKLCAIIMPIVISIHSLRMEGDETTFLKIAGFEIFQSTPSAWRETLARCSLSSSCPYFNPLPPHGGRP